MKINFNNERIKSVLNYCDLVKILNRNINKETMMIEISVCDLENIMCNLHNSIVSIACTYEKDNPHFRDLRNDIGTIPLFNDE